MNKVIIKAVKVVALGGALAAALTGCCMFGSEKCCGEKRCCCKQADCGEPDCRTPKTHGVNASTSVGIGTDGIRVGGGANVGGHGVSGNVGGSMH